MGKLNAIGQQLAWSLQRAKQLDDESQAGVAHDEKINVVGAGGALTAAYEQLRNAAENAEEHLLLQNAIKRFYRQLFIARDELLIRDSGNELAVELTFAGYVPNNSLTKSQLELISSMAARHYAAYEAVIKDRQIPLDVASRWVIDTLAVQVEATINSHRQDVAFVDVAYTYFETELAADKQLMRKIKKDEFGGALFVAIHKALLKSDEAVIRQSLLERYQVTVDDRQAFIDYNKKIDTLFASSAADSVYHAVDRGGAPLRVIRHMIETRPDFSTIITKRELFLEAFEQQVLRDYETVGRRVNRAIIRSVIFLIITKFIIGIAVEVPYDFWAHGKIIWQPLIINLFFPPLYMIMLRLTHTLPGYANTAALVDRVDTMFYAESATLSKGSSPARRYGPIFSFIYIAFGLVVFGAVMWALLMLGFSLVHITIFFVFISAASFLGFRLSKMIRELEIVRSRSNGLTFIRDIIYLPFVVVGQWMSDKYSKVNVITLVLDMMIELPLKTVLRLIRQWGAFIDERKDRIV